MAGFGVKHLHIIIAIICLSVVGGESSNERDANLTVTKRNNMKTSEETILRTSIESTALLRNETCMGSSEAPVFNDTNGSEANNEVGRKSTECPDSVESEVNVTAVQDDFLFGNGSVTQKMLALRHSDCVDLGIRETAGFVAIAFLALSVVGYVGFVLWRRYLLNKYGNGQVLITQDVYDISDLRHFEI